MHPANGVVWEAVSPSRLLAFSARSLSSSIIARARRPSSSFACASAAFFYASASALASVCGGSGAARPLFPVPASSPAATF